MIYKLFLSDFLWLQVPLKAYQWYLPLVNVTVKHVTVDQTNSSHAFDGDCCRHYAISHALARLFSFTNIIPHYTFEHTIHLFCLFALKHLQNKWDMKRHCSESWSVASGAGATNARDPSLAGEHSGNKMSTMNMVILLLAVVLSVFVGFAWMAYCFR